MKAKAFIEKKLEELFSKFEKIKIRYEYMANTGSHIVEIMPFSLFEEKKDYLVEEAKIEDEFETLYPMENIVFISEGSLTEINKPDLELGYDTIIFDYCDYISELEVDGYSEEVENKGCETYALAA